MFRMKVDTKNMKGSSEKNLMMTERNILQDVKYHPCRSERKC